MRAGASSPDGGLQRARRLVIAMSGATPGATEIAPAEGARLVVDDDARSRR